MNMTLGDVTQYDTVDIFLTLEHKFLAELYCMDKLASRILSKIVTAPFCLNFT